MICKGRTRSDGGQLATYLLSLEKNERAEVLEERGFDIGSGLRAGMRLAEIEAEQTRGSKAFYHGIISPAAGETMTREQQMQAVEILEKRLGFQGLPRVVVVHRPNNGTEEHIHVAWSRFDRETGQLRRDSFTKIRNVAASAEISLRFGFEKLRNPFELTLPVERQQRRERSREPQTHAEFQQETRAAKGRDERKAELTALWESTDTAQAFRMAVEAAGYTLARGSRGFVVVDEAGEVHSLARQIGMKKAEVDARLSHLNPGALHDLPGAEEVTAAMKQARQDRARAAKRQDQEFLKTGFHSHGPDPAPELEPDPPPSIAAAVTRIDEPRARLDAAGILAELTRNHSTFTRQDLARLVDRETGGGGREPWMMQAGGIEALDDDHKASAERSYSTWATQAPKAGARYGLAEYVVYVQARHEERDGEKPGLRDERQANRAAFEKLLGEVEASADLIRLGPDRTGRERLTARAMLETELTMEGAARVLHHRDGHGATGPRRVAALDVLAENGQTLGDEQRQAFDHIMAAGDLKLVVGFAGTGKSTMLGAARLAFEAEGFRVRGTALSGIAADSLDKGAGICSRTLHSLLHQLDTIEARAGQVAALDRQLADFRGRSHKALRYRADLAAKRDRMAADLEAARLTNRDVLVVDEAGMIGSRQMERLLSEAQEAGAKVILVGDAEQLQAIEAGGAFRALRDRHGAAEITEVRRQRQDWQRNATRDFATGRTADALARYEAVGMVHQAGDRDQAKGQLVEAWSAARQEHPAAAQIILAYTRADVADLNQRARKAYQAEGRLGEDHELTTEAGRQAFATGDRLYFLKNDTRLAVKNGSLGTIESIDGARVSVRLDAGPGEEGRRVDFDTRDYGNVAHGYAATVHKSQGVTVDRAYVLASRYMDRHAAYVGMTRHRDRADLYFGADEFKDADRLARRLGRDAGKDTTLDYLARQEQGQSSTISLRAAVAEFWRRLRGDRPDQAQELERRTTDQAGDHTQKTAPGRRPSDMFSKMLDRMSPAQRTAFEQVQARDAAENLRRELERQRRPDDPGYSI